MGVDIVKKLNIDFYDTKYISVNAKQHDISSRYILISCYNQKEFFPIDNVTNCAYIRYRKSDEYVAFDSCEITNDGKVLIELTPQMLAVEGRCFADLIIVNNAEIEIDNETNEPYFKDASVVSTMTFCINVLETACDNDIIESSYEFNALNELLIKANANYTVVLTKCKESEINAKNSETKAEEFKISAEQSKSDAKESEDNARMSETKAEEFKISAEQSKNNAKESEDNAKNSETNAAQSAETSVTYGTMARSYAVGDTDTRENENVDNAKYYYSKIRNISETLGGLFIPMGTISFSELQSVEKESGYVYHIKEDFISDSTFKDGGGVSYAAGTNVYCTNDGYWDCFTGGNITVIDDDNGNVEIVYANTLVDTSALQMIEELKARVKELENQTVIGITE